MSVMGSMYTGISGLTTHAERMSVLGNNLANTSTVGFKSGTVQFEDLFYSSRSHGASVGQIGHGSRVSSIYQDFSQGAYENTGAVTNVAIGGRGFFLVNDPINGSEYYTRAGDFKFDNEGFLINPQGMRVQGWAAADSSTAVVKGAVGDLQIDSFQSEPKETSKMSLSLNLSNKAIDKAKPTTPGTAANGTDFFALFSTWDAKSSPAKPLGDDKYSYQKTMKVFDKTGSAHEVTVYFDKAKTVSGEDTWEYIVTCNPNDDGRPNMMTGSPATNTRTKGLLMAGTISFSNTGAMKNMSAYTYDAGAAGTADPDSKDNWKAATMSEDGFPIFTANFLHLEDVNDTDDKAADGASPELIALDFGFSSKNASRAFENAAETMTAVEADGTKLAKINDVDINKTKKSATSFSIASTTHSMEQDGYTAGFLQEITIDKNGVVGGRYSNGQKQEMFVLALADFADRQSLSLQGGNLYAESSQSGQAVVGRANTGRLGNVSSNTLELSNVDMSRQMVKLILTQRGYQSNSKVVTTSDEMLQEAINLKR
ncbi:flagellar hook protein FlgE [Halodesulfovibrio sp.]|uniref:flagellar hook protein FlgE n=1 Tax=Halodesulfovibrio sp. TaxID=1912772 RepID=UPI0025F613D6|nr:flagellar hook protein FlgE [Halodesulfovibrio sp.]MCT4627271.1 flagellar hook protein FlgE [Halodesulfovibrio sp.]